MPQLKLTAVLGLNKTGFDAGMNAATKQVEKFGKGIHSMLSGMFGIAAIASFTRNLIQTVSHIEDLSEKTGVAAETLQELEYAAKQSGSSVDAVATAFRALSKARLEALKDPNSDTAQVFKAMGINQQDLKTNTLEQTFKRIAETIRTTDFGASELKMVNELLGRSGDELIPMMKAGIEDSAEQARKLGLVISGDLVSAIDDAGDAMDRFATKIKATVAPAVKFIVDRMRDVYDFADILVGNIGAIAGTLMGGGSLKEAREAGREHVFGVIERREKEDEAAKEKVAKREKLNQIDDRKKQDFVFKEVEKQNKRFHIEESPLGRIGAFSGGGSSQNSTQAQGLQSLRRIESALIQKGIIVRDVK